MAMGYFRYHNAWVTWEQLENLRSKAHLVGKKSGIKQRNPDADMTDEEIRLEYMKSSYTKEED